MVDTRLPPTIERPSPWGPEWEPRAFAGPDSHVPLFAQSHAQESYSFNPHSGPEKQLSPS